MTTPLNRDQRLKAEEIVAAGLASHAALPNIRFMLERSRLTVEYWETMLADSERRIGEANVEIKALGFHDIRHARGELAK